jgi:hypothetical protein
VVSRFPLPGWRTITAMMIATESPEAMLVLG